MLGAFLSGRLAGRRSPREIVSLGYSLIAIAAVSNLLATTCGCRLPCPGACCPLVPLHRRHCRWSPPPSPAFLMDLPQPARRRLLTVGFARHFSSLVAG